MRKITLLTFFLVFNVQNIMTQVTCTFGLSLRLKQSEIAAFVESVPNCKIVNSEIVLDSDVTDLSLFNQFEGISGGLKLDNCINLENLNGLSNISSLPKLEIIGSNKLKDLTALSYVKNFRRLLIKNNNSIESLENWPKSLLSPINLELENTKIKSLSGLIFLDSTAQNISLIENKDLNDISSLMSLKTIEGKIVISKNRSLSDISPLNNIQKAGRIEVLENFSLKYLPNFDFLDSVGVFRMKGMVVDYVDLDVIYWPINTPKIQRIRYIEELSFENLQGPDTLLGYNHLKNLQTLLIVGCSYKAISGFNGLNSENLAIFLRYNGKLKSISGFENLKNNLITLKLDSNYALEKINAFKNLITAGQIIIWGNNVALDSIVNFENLKSIRGHFFIINNGKLKYFSFPALESAGEITISGNRELIDFSLPSLIDGGGIFLQHNIKLTSIGGLKNIDWKTMKGGDMINNYSLTDCVYDFYCNFLKHHTARLINNGPGCSSREEILERCLALSAEDEIETTHEVKIYPNPVAGPLHIWSEYLPGSRIHIYDSKGMEVRATQAFENTEVIDMSSLPAGLYFVWCRHSAGVEVRRVVKI